MPAMHNIIITTLTISTILFIVITIFTIITIIILVYMRGVIELRETVHIIRQKTLSHIQSHLQLQELFKTILELCPIQIISHILYQEPVSL